MMNPESFVESTRELFSQLPLGFVKHLFVYDTVDSTNITAKELALTGAAEGTVVVSRVQTHGRGRFDRTWESPEGGLYFSFILSPGIPANHLSLLPLATAVAVARTIESFGVHATIKWPNDLRIGEKKIVGILLESEAKDSAMKYVVVGIGVNLNTDMKKLSPEIRKRSTTLEHHTGCTVDHREFLKRFFLEFDDVYQGLLHRQDARIITEWKQRSDTLGKTVEIRTPSGNISGIACDIDASGFLLVRTTDGSLKTVNTGDCVYLQ